MTYSPWIPVWMGSGFEILALILTVALPETLQRAEGLPNSDDRQQHNGILTKSKVQALKQTIIEYMGKFADRNIALLLLLFLVATLGMQGAIMLLLYASSKFDWTIAQVR